MKNLIVILACVSIMSAGCSKRERYAGEWRDICKQNITTIEAAKNQWSLEYRKDLGTPVSEEAIIGATGYVKEKPVCPAQGVYSLNPVGQVVTCSVPSHN